MLVGMALVGLQMGIEHVHGRHVVVVEEQHQVAAREHHGEVLGGGATGVLDPDPGERELGRELPQHGLGLGPRGAVVDDDHLEFADGQRLRAEPGQARGEQLRAVIGRDQDADLRFRCPLAAIHGAPRGSGIAEEDVADVACRRRPRVRFHRLCAAGSAPSRGSPSGPSGGAPRRTASTGIGVTDSSSRACTPSSRSVAGGPASGPLSCAGCTRSTPSRASAAGSPEERVDEPLRQRRRVADVQHPVGILVDRVVPPGANPGAGCQRCVTSKRFEDDSSSTISGGGWSLVRLVRADDEHL